MVIRCIRIRHSSQEMSGVQVGVNALEALIFAMAVVTGSLQFCLAVADRFVEGEERLNIDQQQRR